jgi:phosphate starvation-inducible protein PhoH and related proteins
LSRSRATPTVEFDRPSDGSLVMIFDNTALLVDLFGQHDQNLAMIEERLSIRATPRGNRVALAGEPHAVERARKVLEDLYHRLESGLEVGPSEVDGALRLIDRVPAAAEGGEGLAMVRTRKRVIQPRTPTQDLYIRRLNDTPLVLGTGPAGTGKTYLAVAVAAAALERGEVDRIILARPAVEAGERLGFLPGDMREKVDPYLRPLYDALYDCLPAPQVERGLESGQIEIAPLAFMRGRTLAHAFVILDEAQNCTRMQMKMALTRLGENGRMAVTGDPSQIDLPDASASGLIEAQRILKGIEGVCEVCFTSADVVRHALVARIVEAYDGAEGREPQ